MVKRLLKILLGLFLVPVCVGFSWQFFATVFSLTYRPNAPYLFVGGGILYLVIHFVFRQPILTYVFGHELTHAFFAMLFGGAVKSFHAGERGGRVTVTKSNFIITLAPYFFPLYTFFALVLYGMARATDAGTTAANVLIFVSGATFTFHLILTMIFLQTDQNDIREYGAVFSFPLIFLFNVLFAAFLVFIFLAEDMNYLKFMAGGIMKSVNMIAYVFVEICHFVERYDSGT